MPAIKPATKRKARAMNPFVKLRPAGVAGGKKPSFGRFRVEYPKGKGHLTFISNRLTQDQARQLGLKPETSKTVTIATFYPLGAHDKEHGGQGVGTVAFRKAVAMAKRMGARALIVTTDEPKLQRIAEKQGFKVLDDSSDKFKQYGKKVRPRKTLEKPFPPNL